MTTPTRCTRCTRRTSKNMRLAQYAREPRCACGGRLYEDRYRVTKERAKGRGTCRCDHYPFPHRRRSLYCCHGALGRMGISFYERHAPACADLRRHHREHGSLEHA